MRAFLAVELNDAVRRELNALSERLRRSKTNASWTKPANTHITLRFLGDIDDTQADALGATLGLAYEAVAPFWLSITGVGAFPNIRRPRVVWVGVEPAGEPMAGLHGAAESAARAIGLEPEDRAYSPHITLARLRDPRHPGDLPSFLEREVDFQAGDIQVVRVVLLKSTLKPTGAEYSLIREFPFLCRT